MRRTPSGRFQRIVKGDDATAALAMAEMCFQRLLVLQNKDMHLYFLAQVLDVKKQLEIDR